MDSNTLAHELTRFTGTEVWYRHPLNRNALYTDGVKYFAEQAGAYWFLDIVVTEFLALLAQHPFLVVDLKVADDKAGIVVSDGNDTVLKEKKIRFTDCPPGDWRFYITDDVILLPSEY